MAPASLLAIKFCSKEEQAGLLRALGERFHGRGQVRSAQGAPERVEALLVNTDIERWKYEEGLSALASAAGEGVVDYVLRVGGGLRYAAVGVPWAIYFFEKARRIGGVLGKEWHTGSTRGIADLLTASRRHLPTREPVILRGMKEVRRFLRQSDSGLSPDAERELSGALLSVGLGWRDWLDAGRGAAASAGLEKLHF